MARLFDMYKDTTSPDVYNSFRQIRQETEANRDKTMGNVGNILTSTNLGRLQQEYREGSGRYAGITDPDKRFQVYYDVVRSIDPKEAENAKETYNNERNLRMNREISEAYKGGVGAVGNDISNLEAEIKLLEDAIAREEQIKLEDDIAREEQVKMAVPLDDSRVPSDTAMYVKSDPIDPKRVPLRNAMDKKIVVQPDPYTTFRQNYLKKLMGN